MTVRPSHAVLATAVAALALAGCATDPDTGERRMSRAGTGALIGAGSGALLGAIIGGRNNRTETLVGAGIGAIAGAGIGAYMDRQERDLRQRTAGTGIEVERQGDEIKISMPDAITFDFGRSELKPEFRPALQALAESLAAYPSTFIDVMGHTDNVGTAAANQRLSEERARTVANALTAFGVQPARIATRGYGFSLPVASNATAEGRARNRRVEIRLSPVTADDVARARG